MTRGSGLAFEIAGGQQMRRFKSIAERAASALLRIATGLEFLP
jgi:hypothetical protein